MEEPQLGRRHERRPGNKTHCCINCTFPIAVYGRMYPCLHTYCLCCATDMDKCFLCQAQIARIERITSEQGLYISATTLQSFKTEKDLEQHTKRMYLHLMQSQVVLHALNTSSRPAAAPLQPGPQPPRLPPPPMQQMQPGPMMGQLQRQQQQAPPHYHYQR